MARIEMLNLKFITIIARAHGRAQVTRLYFNPYSFK
uniref:Uncharacterized protein n=1 Tax=Arundo donax TaxID=35708 RepID=A0A0A9FI74_ARUDO